MLVDSFTNRMVQVFLKYIQTVDQFKVDDTWVVQNIAHRIQQETHSRNFASTTRYQTSRLTDKAEFP